VHLAEVGLAQLAAASLDAARGRKDRLGADRGAQGGGGLCLRDVGSAKADERGEACDDAG
jgi:hypothetical protein